MDNRNFFIIAFSFLLCVFGTEPLQAQDKGLFEKSITFMSSPRTLSYFVPQDYDSTKKYQLMVGLHGLGDNSTNYRNALITSLNWRNHFPQTIFVFPDGGNDQGKDFYEPENDEEIIGEAISYTMQRYHIDTDRVILQGFSLGGRSALKYGLDNPGEFFGLLLNTPAIQGILDAENDPQAGIEYNYANASQIPVHITNGAEDFFYLWSIERIFEEMVKNNGKVYHAAVPGLGHSVAAFSHLEGAIPFFEDPATAPYDAEIIKIDAPQRTCGSPVNTQVLIRNTGSQDITEVELEYEVNGSSQSHTWSGNLGSYENAWIPLPGLNPSAGSHTLEVEITSLNSGQPDTISTRNTHSEDFIIAGTGMALPLSEGFESIAMPPAGWVQNQTGSIFLWYVDDGVSRDGQNSIAAFNTILLFNTYGIREEIMSPVLDLSTTGSPELSFDMAYNYHKYTPPYFPEDTTFADTLEIAISTDCGTTYTVLYKKGGEELKTFDEAILNPLSLPSVFLDPEEDEWRTEKIDLSAYSSETDAIIRFSYISAIGGAINIDNVLIDQPSSVEEREDNFSFEIYPNPANDHFRVRATGAGAHTVNLYDVSGRRILSDSFEANGQSETWIGTQHFKNGIYFVETISAKGDFARKKLIINR
ncbi:MAG: T9SS type A sorting domain-containing protein [Bacteroidia bacterium]